MLKNIFRTRFALLFSSLSLFSLNPSIAQDLWGLTTDGGVTSSGTIFSISSAGAHSVEFSFPKTEGGIPKGEFIRVANGTIYGVTELGGINGSGILFEYDPLAGSIVVLHNFDAASGERPIRGLVEAPNGKLYGTCSSGGANNFGVIYEFDPSNGIYVNRVDFTGPGGNGQSPRAQLTLHTNGTLYGTSWIGGTFNFGTLFSYTPGASSVNVLHNFSVATGGRPFGGVIQDGNKLIGTCQFGSQGSVIYEYDLNTSTHSKLHDFATTADGTNPLARLVLVNGVYYGTASGGGASNEGTLFSYNPSTSTFTNLLDFTSLNGGNPLGGLILASDGKLYGITSEGGTNNGGVIFSLDPNTSNYNVLYNVNNAGLSDGWGALLQLPDGSLIGHTSDGGEGSSGGAFRYVIGGAFTKNVDYGFSPSGKPFGRFIEASNGLLYATANIGGTTGEGVIFSYNPNSGAFNLLFNLGGNNGSFPEGTLCEYNGSLYGTCRLGGTGGLGTIFKYEIATGNFTKIANMSSVLGSEPIGQPVLANNNKLYCTALNGGANGFGTIVEIDPVSNSAVAVHDFDDLNGSLPQGDLMLSTSGLLYGTTVEGGTSDDGVLYQFSTGGTFTKLFDCDDALGGNPSGKLLELSGKLYGTTSTGAGVNFAGGIFSWDITNGTFSQEANFTISDGDNSQSELIEGPSGLLWGTAKAGGSAAVPGFGTIFNFDPVAQTIALQHDFDMTIGGVRPTNGLIEIAPSSLVQLNIQLCLQGPFNSGTSLMNDAVRSLGSFPTTEPYTGLGFNHVGEGGGETINPAILANSGNNAIVDWVFVEIRDKSADDVVVNTRAALVQRDGDVVDLDGTSTLAMAVPSDAYFVSVRHRNHLGIMTAGTVSLSSSSSNAIDFRTSGVSVFGTSARVDVNGTLCMWSGNVNPDNLVKYTGSANDRDPILVKIGGSVPTATVIDYTNEDINLDGIVKYTGSANDRDPILVNIGGNVPTATRIEQLP